MLIVDGFLLLGLSFAVIVWGEKLVEE